MEYGWIIGSLILMFFWLLIFLIRKDLRKEMLIISFVFGLLGITGHFYYGDYWKPIHLFKLFNLEIGIEDYFFTFAVAGIGSVWYEVLFRKIHKKSRKNYNQELSKVEILLSGGLGIIIFLFLEQLTNLSLILTSSIGMSAIGLFVIFFRKELLKPILFTAITFPVFVLGVEIITNFLSPGFSNLWLNSGIIGIRVFEFPLEELIWHFAWVLAISSLFEFYYGLSDK